MISKMISPSFVLCLGMAQISCSASHRSFGIFPKDNPSNIKKSFSFKLMRRKKPNAPGADSGSASPEVPLPSSGTTSLGYGQGSPPKQYEIQAVSLPSLSTSKIDKKPSTIWKYVVSGSEK